MISTTDFKTGLSLMVDGQLYAIVEFQHVKPGKGGAFVRTKLRRMRDASVFERTFRAGEKFQEAYVEKRTLQFMYRTDGMLHLMDTKSYEQLDIAEDIVGASVGFLKEAMELEGQFHDGKLIGLHAPMFVDVNVTSTEPGIRGDTSKSSLKPAVLETGATVHVPLFVETGDRVRVDTRTGAYVSRV